MSERISTPEPCSELPEESLARLLRERGAEDEEARSALMAWTLAQEALVESAPDSEATVDARLSFELKRARLYLSAGYTEDARQAFEDAYSLAWNERRDDLARQIQDEMEPLANGNR